MSSWRTSQPKNYWPNIAPDAIRYLWWFCSKERTARTPFARLTRARAPSSIARPAVMRLSQPSRQLAPGLSSWRRNSLRGCSMRLRLPMICSRPNSDGRARLTRRELEVLAAMADGASNKAIVRRLGISFHTAKFHVAAILAKLDADSRTEAVAKAAQLGLVML